MCSTFGSWEKAVYVFISCSSWNVPILKFLARCRCLCPERLRLGDVLYWLSQRIDECIERVSLWCNLLCSNIWAVLESSESLAEIINFVSVGPKVRRKMRGTGDWCIGSFWSIIPKCHQFLCPSWYIVHGGSRRNMWFTLPDVTYMWFQHHLHNLIAWHAFICFLKTFLRAELSRMFTKKYAFVIMISEADGAQIKITAGKMP